MLIDDSRGYALLDQLDEEFADRFRRGERPSLKEYTDRYPELADEIHELFPGLIRVEHVEEICQDRDEAEAPTPPLSRCRHRRFPQNSRVPGRSSTRDTSETRTFAGTAVMFCSTNHHI